MSLYTQGMVIGPAIIGVGVNKVTPRLDKSSPVYGAHAIEFVIGSAGLNSDESITIEVTK